jgi:hypothetical protein
MRARDRFEHTEPWGFSPEASGVRTRPDLELEIGRARSTLKLDELDAPDTQHMSPRTALLTPVKAASTAVLPPVAPAEARPTTQPLARPIRAASQPPPARSSAPPALARAHTPMQPQPPLQAAVHASVYASVHATLLAASQLSRVSTLPTVVPSVPPPAPAAMGWTPAQRIYVLVTAVALSVMATTIVFLTMGSPDVRGSRDPHAARVPAVAVATLDTSSSGSATRKETAPAVADSPAPQAGPRRIPAGTAGRGGSGGAVSATGGAPSPGTSASAATKLDDAARSAKMLREQLNTAVN